MAVSPLLVGSTPSASSPISGLDGQVLTQQLPQAFPGTPLASMNWIPQPVRGTFVLPANPSMSRTIMFNPNEVTDDKATHWGTIEVPGASPPVYQFGAGGERLISFDLWIDGDRGRFGRSQQRPAGITIEDELQFYRSLVYPQMYGGDMASVFPFIVIFSMGTLYQRVNCIVKKCTWKVKFWTPDMRPVRAIVSLQLGEVVNQSVTANQVLQLGGVQFPSQLMAGSGGGGNFI